MCRYPRKFAVASLGHATRELAAPVQLRVMWSDKESKDSHAHTPANSVKVCSVLTHWAPVTARVQWLLKDATPQSFSDEKG